MRRRTRIAAVAFGVAGLVMVGTAGTAAAKGAYAPRHAVGASEMAQLAPAGMAHRSEPEQYQQAESVQFDSPSAEQTGGSVACPSGTVPLGGGADNDSGSTAVSINESYPDSDGWAATVNNASGSDNTFVVYAICAKERTGYVQAEGSATDNPAGTKTEVSATCPRGTKAVGGGATDSSTSTDVAMSETLPLMSHDIPRAWATYVNNAGDADDTATGFAICSRVIGISVQESAPTDNPAGEQTSASAVCPTGSVPLGGGASETSPDLAVNLNYDWPAFRVEGLGAQPNGNVWTVFEGNASTEDDAVTAYATCGRN